MRRFALATAVAALMLLPAAGAAASCPTLEGHAMLDFGNTMTGKAHFVYDGQHINVDFTETGFPPPAFTFHFPGGDVDVTESATTETMGPLTYFESTISVVGGGSGSWTWSGIANTAVGRARIMSISGDLCITP